jgi:hypothetical protein
LYEAIIGYFDCRIPAEQSPGRRCCWRGKPLVSVAAGQLVLGHKRSRQLRTRANRESDHNGPQFSRSRRRPTGGGTRAAARGINSDEMLIGRPDFRDLDDSTKSPDALPLTEKAAVTQQRCSSS